MKTIKEAAKECKLSFKQKFISNSLQSDNNAYCDGIEVGFKSGSEFAQRWIPVTEELPKSTDIKYEIICEYDNGSHDIYIIYDGASESSIEKMLLIHNITKWRPIEYK